MLTNEEQRNEDEKTKEYTLWHRRLAHAGVEKLRLLFQATEGLKHPLKQPTRSDSTCEPCIYAKQAKVINRVSPEQATRPLQRVFTDFAGPLKEASLGGNLYLLTFTDDYSRKTWVYTTKTRTELYERFKEWKQNVEKESGLQLVALRSDKGGEFNKLEEKIKQGGVEMEYTVAYTPEQNGVAERLNRTIFTMVRAMLFEAGLPDKFWEVAVGTAAYIKNKAAQGDDRKTPEKLWTGKKPDISHLRVFGCLAYRFNNKPKKTKLEPRSARCIFVGYTETSRQYRVYDRQRNQVIQTSTVKFVESKKGWATIMASSNDDEAEAEDDEGEDLVELRPSGASHGTPEFHNDTEQQPSQVQQDYTVGQTEQRLEAVEYPTVVGANGGSEEDQTTSSVGASGSNERPKEQDRPSRDGENEGLRRSERRKKAPKRYGDFAMAATELKGDIPIPTSYEEAINDKKYGKQWEKAIREELQAHESFNTWTLVDSETMESDRKPVGCRWVFDTKCNKEGIVQ